MLCGITADMNIPSQPVKSVLIVEKQPNYTQLLVKQVMFAGLRPLVAVTGEGGLRKALEFYPQLVLLELDLTDMNGLEFVRLMKEHQRLQTIPIVAMSIFFQLRGAALNAGCNDFLKKPVKMIELMGCVRRHSREGQSAKLPLPPGPVARYKA